MRVSRGLSRRTRRKRSERGRGGGRGEQEGEKILRMEESRAGGRVSRWKQAGWINFGATVPEADA